MTKIRIVAVVCAVLFLAAGKSAAQDAEKAGEQLIGKWEMTKKVGDKELKIQIEFTKDGEVIATSMDLKLEGTYKVLNSTTLEIEWKNEAGKKDKTTFKVEKDILTLTDPKGKSDKFMRVKT